MSKFKCLLLLIISVLFTLSFACSKAQDKKTEEKKPDSGTIVLSTEPKPAENTNNNTNAENKAPTASNLNTLNPIQSTSNSETIKTPTIVKTPEIKDIDSADSTSTFSSLNAIQGLSLSGNLAFVGAENPKYPSDFKIGPLTASKDARAASIKTLAYTFLSSILTQKADYSKVKEESKKIIRAGIPPELKLETFEIRLGEPYSLSELEYGLNVRIVTKDKRTSGVVYIGFNKEALLINSIEIDFDALEKTYIPDAERFEPSTYTQYQ